MIELHVRLSNGFVVYKNDTPASRKCLSSRRSRVSLQSSHYPWQSTVLEEF